MQARHTPLNLTSDSLEALSLASEVPRSSSDTSSDRQQTAHSSVSSYGGLGAGHSAMHHGQGGKKDGMDGEVERFFRAVDRAVQAHHSDVSGLPLMLAALPEHHHLFQAISHNPRLMKQGLLINPEGLTLLLCLANPSDGAFAHRPQSRLRAHPGVRLRVSQAMGLGLPAMKPRAMMRGDLFLCKWE